MTEKQITVDEIFGTSNFQENQKLPEGMQSLPKNFMENIFENELLAATKAFEEHGGASPADFIALLIQAVNCGLQAQFHLGLAAYRGYGGTQDFRQAYQYFLNAAVGGHMQSSVILSYMSYYGHGVLKDTKQAYQWAAIASQYGLQYPATLKDAIAAELSPHVVLELEEKAKIRDVPIPSFN